MRAPPLLRTRVARQILGLFLLCAMLPVAAVVLLAYRKVAGQLKLEAEERLRGESKTAGMLVFVRIDILATKLGHFAEAIGTRGLPPEFEAIGIERADGGIESLHGGIDRVPELSKAQLRHLATGLPVVLTSPHQGKPRLYVVIRQPGGAGVYPRVWGAASLGLIVGGDAEEGLVPPDTRLCLLDPAGTPLECAQAEAATALRSRDATSGGSRWSDRDGTRFLMGSWEVFLNRAFAASRWSVGLSVTESAALAPLAAFRRTFFLGIGLAVLLVFALSHIQLRKRMTPLAELLSGTRRLSEGDFSTPVVVQSNDEFAVLADSFNRMAGDLQQHFTTLSSLHSIDRAALEGQSRQAVAEAAFSGATRLLGADQVAVAAAVGDHPGFWSVLTTGAAAGPELAMEVMPSPAEFAELATDREFFLAEAGVAGHSYFGSLNADPTRERVIFPIMIRGQPRGALVIALKDRSALTDRAAALGRRLADQLTVALSNVSLVSELDALSVGALTALARTIDAVSPWTAGHSERVSRMAAQIGSGLGLDRHEVDRLRRGGLLHDLGKLAIPAAILDKPGRLTDEEMAIVQSHPAVGAKILAPITAFQELIPLVLSHHELLDGSGYPNHLQGEQISLPVRIMTVADVFDALVSDRPYRAGLTAAAALQILREGEGRRFDAAAVRSLEAAIELQGVPSERLTLWHDPGEHRALFGTPASPAEEKVEACL